MEQTQPGLSGNQVIDGAALLYLLIAKGWNPSAMRVIPVDADGVAATFSFESSNSVVVELVLSPLSGHDFFCLKQLTVSGNQLELPTWAQRSPTLEQVRQHIEDTQVPSSPK